MQVPLLLCLAFLWPGGSAFDRQERDQVVDKLKDDVQILEGQLHSHHSDFSLEGQPGKNYAVFFHGLRDVVSDARFSYEDEDKKAYRKRIIENDPFLFAGHFAFSVPALGVCQPLGWGPSIQLKRERSEKFGNTIEKLGVTSHVALGTGMGEDVMTGNEAFKKAAAQESFKGILTQDYKHFVRACRNGARVMYKEVGCVGGTTMPALDKTIQKEGIKYGFPPLGTYPVPGWGETKFNCVTMPANLQKLQEDYCQIPLTDHPCVKEGNLTGRIKDCPREFRYNSDPILDWCTTCHSLLGDSVGLNEHEVVEDEVKQGQTYKKRMALYGFKYNFENKFAEELRHLNNLYRMLDGKNAKQGGAIENKFGEPELEYCAEKIKVVLAELSVDVDLTQYEAFKFTGDSWCQQQVFRVNGRHYIPYTDSVQQLHAASFGSLTAKDFQKVLQVGSSNDKNVKCWEQVMCCTEKNAKEWATDLGKLGKFDEDTADVENPENLKVIFFDESCSERENLENLFFTPEGVIIA